MSRYKWLGMPPLGKGVFRYKEKDYSPGDILPEDVTGDMIKQSLKKGKVEVVKETTKPKSKGGK